MKTIFVCLLLLLPNLSFAQDADDMPTIVDREVLSQVHKAMETLQGTNPGNLCDNLEEIQSTTAAALDQAIKVSEHPMWIVGLAQITQYVDSTAKVCQWQPKPDQSQLGQLKVKAAKDQKEVLQNFQTAGKLTTTLLMLMSQTAVTDAI